MNSSELHIALLGPVFIPFIIAIILFSSAGKDNKPKLFLSAAMLNASFVFFGNYIYFTHNYELYSYMHGLHIASVLLIYPSIYAYLVLLVKPQKTFKKLSLHFIPALLFLVLSVSIFFPLLNLEQRIYFLSEYRLHPNFNNFWLETLWVVRFINVLVLFLQIVLYSTLIYRLQKKHNAAVQECFSNPWNVNLNWMKVINITFVSSAVICIFFYTINPVKLLGDERYLIYPFYLLSGIISIIGVLGNSQASIFNEEEGKVAYSKSTDKDLKKEIEAYFEKEKPYLNPELKIWDICSEFNTNRTYISNFINKTYHINFSQFVNQYRIAEAKDSIKKHPEKSFEEIAGTSGFGSAASLNRAFKIFEGISPKKYKG